MKFLTENFLLHSPTAIHLYESYAKKLPIIDYHCHVDPMQIAQNTQFDTITDVWLGGDHYKWRLMRSNGVCEEEITGNADAHTKFLRFAQTLPKAIGNPIYHWAHMELKMYFGYEGVLNGDTAEEVWELCNRKLKEPALSVRGIIESSNVELIGTTDDPTDDLRWHAEIAKDESFKTKVVPTFRPDKAMQIDKAGFKDYIARLSEVSKIGIRNLDSLKTALTARLEHFCKHGCKASDHGLDSVVYEEATDKQVDKILRRALAGKPVSKQEADAFKTHVLLFLAREYRKRDVVMQIHYGALRNVNTKMFERLGADAGFDCLSTRPCGEAVAKLLDALEKTDDLPRTILYSLNAQDNAMLDVFLGAFQSSEIAGKIQHGSAWWFSDTKHGMQEQMRSLAELSVLGNFIGMLTDSRSFLSYARHDYFRRIVCDMVGTWVEDGEYPNDEAALKEIIEGICCMNAKRYFTLA